MDEEKEHRLDVGGLRTYKRSGREVERESKAGQERSMWDMVYRFSE